MPSVYIETTIPSFYFDTRQSAAVMTWRHVTRVWWDKYRNDYQLVTSAAVHAELMGAPRNKADDALTLLAGISLLPEADGILEVAEYYIEHHLMPAEAGGDAVHLAYASWHKIDYLLTWNCRHLANMNKIQHLEVLNGRLGLHVPLVTTPLTLMPEATP